MNIATNIALSHFINLGELQRPAFEVRCKTGYAAARNRMVVHHVERVIGIRDGDRLRFAARWLCGGRSSDAVIVAEPDAHGGTCARCAELSLGPVVYRCLDATGRLLYVGSTGNGATTRLQFHEKNAAWWPDVVDVQMEHFPTLEAARAAESLAIRTEHPAHNIAGRSRGQIAFAVTAA